jgi:Dolichyl-phosphate-mannose-protein mannosyltransferase
MAILDEPDLGYATAEPTQRTGRRPVRAPALLAAAYLLGALWLLPQHRHELNPDGVSYLSIARHYADGHWSEAINGYWSPLYSWLAWPLLRLPADPLLLMKLVNLVCGLLALGGVWLLSARFTRQHGLRVVAVAALVAPVLGWALTEVTPDLLLVTVLVWYLYFLTSPSYHRDLAPVLATGALGGLAYLTKSYAVLVIPLQLVLVHGWPVRRAGRAERLHNARRLAAAAIAMAAVSLPWVAVLTAHYHRLTISTAAGYNWRILGPHASGHPMLTQGLFAPPNPDAVSAWEDPARFDVPGWSVSLVPPHNLRHFAELIYNNVLTTVTDVGGFSALAFGILVAAVALTRLRADPLDANDRRVLAIVALSAALFPLGYLPLDVDPRYLWVVLPLVVLAATRALDTVVRRNLVGTGTVAALAVALVASCVLPVPDALLRERSSVATYTIDAPLIRRQVPAIAGQPVASDAAWGQSLYLCYLVSARYFGQVRADPVQAGRSVAARKIRFFLHWGDPGVLPGYLSAGTVVFTDRARALTVIQLPG